MSTVSSVSSAPHSSRRSAGRRFAGRRSPLARFLIIATLCLVAPIFVFGATVAVTVAATGVATVSVAESGPDGMNLFIPVPVVLFDIAVASAPRFMPAEDLAQVRDEIEPYLPMLRELAEAIEDLPSATLIEVEDGRDRVTIRKVGRNFEIKVHSDDADVRVSLPTRLLGRSLDLFV